MADVCDLQIKFQFHLWKGLKRLSTGAVFSANVGRCSTMPSLACHPARTTRQLDRPCFCRNMGQQPPSHLFALSCDTGSSGSDLEPGLPAGLVVKRREKRFAFISKTVGEHVESEAVCSGDRSVSSPDWLTQVFTDLTACRRAANREAARRLRQRRQEQVVQLEGELADSRKAIEHATRKLGHIQSAHRKAVAEVQILRTELAGLKMSLVRPPFDCATSKVP